jgi:hypothetical protein
VTHELCVVVQPSFTLAFLICLKVIIVNFLQESSEFHKRSFECAVDSIQAIAASHLWQVLKMNIWFIRLFILAHLCSDTCASIPSLSAACGCTR